MFHFPLCLPEGGYLTQRMYGNIYNKAVQHLFCLSNCIHMASINAVFYYSDFSL